MEKQNACTPPELYRVAIQIDGGTVGNSILSMLSLLGRVKKCELVCELEKPPERENVGGDE